MRFWKGSMTKQIKYVMGITCLIFCMLCVFINDSIREMMHLEADEYTKVAAIDYQNQIALLYDKMETFFMSMSQEPWLLEIMEGSIGQKTAYIHGVEERLAQFKILEPYIVDIALVNNTMHYSNLFGRETLDGLRDSIGEETFRWAGVMQQEFRDFQDRDPVFVYAGTAFRETENLGTVVISVDASVLDAGGREAANSYFLLVQEGGILHSFHTPAGMEEELFACWRKNPRENDWKDMPYYIHSVYLPDLGCYLASFLDTRNLDFGISGIQRLIWLCVVLLGAASVLLFLILNRGFVKPLGRFYQVIQGIRASGQRKLKGRMELQGCAEVELIGDEFRGMMEDIKRMNQKIFDNASALYEIELQKKETELAFLRSQIDPHFLYNTLEAVRRMALARNVPEIADMVVDMGKILRYSIKGEPIVTLGEELVMIKSYIRIQQMRFADKISVGYFIPEEALSIPMPKMLIQPLVENAVFYGIEPANWEGVLYIGARIEGKALIVTVKDNGVGIPTDKLERLKKRLAGEEWDMDAHLGLQNVHMQIRLRYGEGYGIQVESSREDGTTVTMRLGTEEVGRCIRY